MGRVNFALNEATGLPSFMRLGSLTATVRAVQSGPRRDLLVTPEAGFPSPCDVEKVAGRVAAVARQHRFAAVIWEKVGPETAATLRTLGYRRVDGGALRKSLEPDAQSRRRSGGESFYRSGKP